MPGRQRIDLDWAAELSAALESGMSVKELSEKLGVSASLVNKHENRTGIRLKRDRTFPPGHGRSYGIDWEAELRAAKAASLSLRELADKLSVSHGAVLAAEDRVGIHLDRLRAKRDQT